ncbi:GTPase Era [Sphingosinicella microcystinivorans]|uniref:GTPase Era n=1 Tax=Sphingosinicella microcystinivorans TaxID=335406 RepID=A0AAD1G1I4_SPHMI|nr:GTPase Era [Sphingosinicella microcystinivorans]RKS91695.1 GTP-binding protein Era [Sphingosinicella microcystinivorans]BBE34676.1 GTPase Era [Sphingosinicella microcystinivorans]
MTEKTFCGVVAVVGAPNAGKSSLVNAIVGQKVAIVSPKVQTTRTRLMGLAIEGETQILLVDTPGIFQPRRRLDRAMVHAAWEGTAGADIVLLVIDGKRAMSEETNAILEVLANRPEPKMLAITKTDIAAKERLLPIAAEANRRVDFAETLMVSSVTGDGIDDLRRTLAAALPEGPWHFPEDQVSNITTRLLAAEITREQLYRQLHEELPYASTVETELWEEQKNGSVKIHQQILVQRDTQKAIVLGKGGTRIRAIGSAARAELETMLDRRVHLFLNVKVKPDWADDRETYRDMGLGWVD